MPRTIVFVGACYIDTILTVPHFPPEDSKLRAASHTIRRGGNGPNTLEVLGQLLQHPSTSHSDVRLNLISVLPDADSVDTQLIKDSLPGIDLGACIYRAEENEAARSYIIRDAGSGSRTIVNWNGLAEMVFREFAISVWKVLVQHDPSDSRDSEGLWWHFEGRIPETTLSCIGFLRESCPMAKISVEIEKPGREGLRELAEEADVVFFSKSWAEAEGFSDARAFLETQGKVLRERNPTLFCTWGSDGAATYSNGKADAVKPKDIEQVVDTVGAGDTFTAGVLYELAVRGRNNVDALNLGVAIAGEKVQREGFQGYGDMMRRHVSAKE